MKAHSSTVRRTTMQGIGRLAGILFVAICLIASALSISLPRGSKAANEPVVLKPVADTFANSEEADKTYGHYSHIDVRGDPAMTAFLRFDVSGLGQGSVAQSHLRLFVANDSHEQPVGLKLFAASPDWDEKAVRWSSQPTLGPQIAEIAPAPLARGQWVDFDLGQSVPGDGAYGFALTSDSHEQIGFRSSSRDEAPQLVLTLQADAAPQPTTVPAPAEPAPEAAPAPEAPAPVDEDKPDVPTIDPADSAQSEATDPAAIAAAEAVPVAVTADPSNTWHPATDHEHGDNCAQPLANNPFVALGNPALDVLKVGEPHNGFKQFLLYKKDDSGKPVAGTFACIVFHIGPLTSKARMTDRHQVHIMMQDGNGHMTDLAWQFQNHGAGPIECDTVDCGGRWRDGSHNKDLAMESEVSSSRLYERWWIDTQDDAGVDENGLVDLYTSVRIEDAATYVQKGELPSPLSMLSNTLFNGDAPLHFTCAKLNISGFCPFNDSVRSTGTWHISIKKTGVFWTDAQGHPVAQGTPGAFRQVLFATSRDYSGLPKAEYDTNRTVIWPN